MIVGKALKTQADLLEITGAYRLASPQLCPVNRRQKQGSEDADDCDDDQQLDQSKSDNLSVMPEWLHA
jgi:hypothetical protein